jgi:hypothetical protein
MIFWILTVQILNSNVEYGYKFIYKTNCEKIGKEIAGKSKQMKYSCKTRKIKLV